MEDLVHDDRASINEQVKDRISNLPDEIIHRILSFLDMKYAIQTSQLSKKWKYIWTSMPYLNLNGEMFRTIPDFARFVKHALSNRNDQKEVSAVELTFRGFFSQFVVKRIVNYAYSHNVRQLKIVQFMCRSDKRFDSVDHNVFSQYPCSSHTLKHLTLATKEQSYYRGYIPKSAWDFPALETLTLSNMQFDLTLHRFSMSDLDIFNICIPKLSNLTINDPDSFPKVFNVVAPQLENLTATIYHKKYTYDSKSFKFLQLSTEGLDSLEKVNLSLPWSWYHFKEERYAPQLLDLFQKLRSAKFLILNPVIIEVYTSQISWSLNIILIVAI
ncbi:hypothetical protein OSB04_011980 [Centaurea solstitialis]|uniref:F-box domain-containing protein n=1 Tax=Centaurea solstitialis TaxID=347529 RepID=A0AA38TL79_9ASTR|nr:hypothetical protein OSB04_011980 [Centaurea solstitialis]